MKTRIYLTVFIMAILVGVTAIAQTWMHTKEVDDKLTQQVSDIYAVSLKIKPGMTRADLLKVFTVEGGFYSPQKRRFIYPSCPYVKIDVEFDVPDTRQIEELSSDVIKKVSKPYLEPPIYD